MTLISGTTLKEITEQAPLRRLVSSSRGNYALMKAFARVGWWGPEPDRHQAVKYALQGNQDDIPLALQDPRYIAYCAEQDRKEEAIFDPPAYIGTSRTPEQIDADIQAFSESAAALRKIWRTTPPRHG